MDLRKVTLPDSDKRTNSIRIEYKNHCYVHALSFLYEKIVLLLLKCKTKIKKYEKTIIFWCSSFVICNYR